MIDFDKFCEVHSFSSISLESKVKKIENIINLISDVKKRVNNTQNHQYAFFHKLKTTTLVICSKKVTDDVRGLLNNPDPVDSRKKIVSLWGNLEGCEKQLRQALDTLVD